MGEYVLETNNLTKIYSRNKAVNNLSLKIRKGDIYGFIGKNGAGKTTAIKLIVGLARPTEGDIKLFGESDVAAGRKKIGVVIENPAYYPFMSAKQNLEVQRIMKGVNDPKVTEEILNIVGLKDVGNKKVKNFSLGMKQRLGIGLALVGDPEFLLLDEPINGLDPTGIKEVRDLILKLNKEAGITVLISSHILGELSKMCNSYGVINNGELVAQVTREELEETVKPSIELVVNNPEKAVSVFKEELGIETIEVSGNELYVYGANDRFADITACLERNDIILQSISKQHVDYEDYFINLMEGEKVNG